MKRLMAFAVVFVTLLTGMRAQIPVQSTYDRQASLERKQKHIKRTFYFEQRYATNADIQQPNLEGDTIGYSLYDSEGRLLLYNQDIPGTPIWHSVAYDKRGNLIRDLFAMGDTSAEAEIFVFTYNDKNQLVTSVEYLRSESEDDEIEKLHFEYDAEGRLLKESEMTGTFIQGVSHYSYLSHPDITIIYHVGSLVNDTTRIDSLYYVGRTTLVRESNHTCTRDKATGKLVLRLTYLAELRIQSHGREVRTTKNQTCLDRTTNKMISCGNSVYVTDRNKKVLEESDSQSTTTYTYAEGQLQYYTVQDGHGKPFLRRSEIHEYNK